ncbi:MAG: sigma-70 family RNA polymerase sigma factor [Acidimicrobiia bacterium]
MSDPLEPSAANVTPMGQPTVMALEQGDAAAARVRVVPPSPWELNVRARLIEGDPSALGDVFDQFSSLVYGLALRVIGDPRAAEDVSQDVFVWLWERPEAFDPSRGSLRSWIGTITHRRAVDHVRREAARRRRNEREASQAVAVPDVGELATALVTAERVRSALDGLPDAQRKAIDLAYFEGQTYREVGETLGIPEGTAKSRLRLALRKIASILEADGGVA